MSTSIKQGLGLLFMIVILGSCQDIQDEASFDLSYPAYFPEPHYQFGKNKLTKDGFELGKSLFYDPIVSRDSTISCSSCHFQGHAFADHNSTLSTGIDGLKGVRNSPAMFNLAWNTSFMWDGGINHIEVMPVAPITNHVEMDETMAKLVAKLRSNAKYNAYFKQVFGNNTEVDDQQILFVLAQFMSLLVSDNSRYDQFRKGLVEFDEEENAGYLIFKKYCTQCHAEPLFTDFSFRNNGLEFKNDDFGRQKVPLLDDDFMKFKVPSLRNVEMTYPYMHDGRFRTLKMVLDHYSTSLVPHENLDPSLKNAGQIGIPLSENDKEKLLVFLKTLNDYTFISNPLFGE
ncbi:MAG: cytochrome-c peroxidase [Lewinellaceae bacterium]|nr:cytochrome-c peroxidase [Lewinellaceae bacterium]